jgi:hypothetical protein
MGYVPMYSAGGPNTLRGGFVHDGKIGVLNASRRHCLLHAQQNPEKLAHYGPLRKGLKFPAL